MSDSSGETVISVAKSALKHFRSVETIEYVWSFVKGEEQIDKILEEINRKVMSIILLYALLLMMS